MYYTEDNIRNLRVRRGGEAEYEITEVYKGPIQEVRLKLLRNGRYYYMKTPAVLSYLNRNKWTIIEPSVINNSYKLY